MVTKVRILKYRISNHTSTARPDDERMRGFAQAREELYDAEDLTYGVEKELFFLQKNGAVDLTVQANPVTIHRHNNGRSDTVDMYYTITYKEVED